MKKSSWVGIKNWASRITKGQTKQQQAIEQAELLFQKEGFSDTHMLLRGVQEKYPDVSGEQLFNHAMIKGIIHAGQKRGDEHLDPPKKLTGVAAERKFDYLANRFIRQNENIKKSPAVKKTISRELNNLLGQLGRRKDPALTQRIIENTIIIPDKDFKKLQKYDQQPTLAFTIGNKIIIPESTFQNITSVARRNLRHEFLHSIYPGAAIEIPAYAMEFAEDIIKSKNKDVIKRRLDKHIERLTNTRSPNWRYIRNTNLGFFAAEHAVELSKSKGRKSTKYFFRTLAEEAAGKNSLTEEEILGIKRRAEAI